MARESYSALQAKIDKEIEKLRKKKEALEARQRQPRIDSIIKQMQDYSITPQEIVAAFGGGTKGGLRGRKLATSGKKSAAEKRPVAPKYRNNETGDTWTGRGRAPRWLAAAEAAGTPRESFLIPEDGGNGAESS
jgi:DNA-binding protein H-NS